MEERLALIVNASSELNALSRKLRELCSVGDDGDDEASMNRHARTCLAARCELVSGAILRLAQEEADGESVAAARQAMAGVVVLAHVNPGVASQPRN